MYEPQYKSNNGMTTNQVYLDVKNYFPYVVEVTKTIAALNVKILKQIHVYLRTQATTLI